MGIRPTTVSQTPGSSDAADAVVSGAFTATGVSAVFLPWGTFNLLIYGSGGPNGAWAGTVQLERSFDGGTTWIICGDASGANGQAVYNTNNVDVSRLVGEPEQGVAYRLHCTAYTSGTINYRLSQSAGAQLNWMPHGSP